MKKEKSEKRIKRVRCVCRCFACNKLVAESKTYMATYNGKIEVMPGLKQTVADERIKLCAVCVAAAGYSSGVARRKKKKAVSGDIFVDANGIHAVSIAKSNAAEAQL